MICLCGHPYLSHESGECTEKGCPCAKWEEVADSPTCGLFDFPAYATQGGGLFGDPHKDITARQTATIADLSKMSWDDPRNPFKNTDERGRLKVGDGSDGRLPWKVR